MDEESPGFYKGRHYTEWVGELKQLKHDGKLNDCENILKMLLDANEAESRKEGWGVAPWYL